VLAEGGLARDRKITAEYDRLAETYAIALGDDLAEKPFDRWFLEELANSAPGQGMDVGCGPGQVAGYLAGLDMEMTGLDLSAEMIERARELHPEISVVQGTFAVPPMPRGGDPRDPGWGLVTAWYAFVHLAQSEIGPTMTSLAKVLCRGGYLAVATHVGDEVQHPGELFGEPTDLDFVLHDPEVIIAAAEAAGLVDLEWYLRGPLQHEAQTRRLYLQGRRPG
jgi:SAM-dependent methyltransferase